MIEEASRVLDFLPLRKSEAEEEYATYLWNSFEILASKDDSQVQSFSLTAFHLLFMLAVQYKVLRISVENPSDYKKVFTLHKPRNLSVLSPTLVTDLSLIPESPIFHMFELVELEDTILSDCKNIIKRRNTEFMHASGNIPSQPELHIENCLEKLDRIQSRFLEQNNTIAKGWLGELEEFEEICEFVEKRLYESRLTLADFQSGQLQESFSSCFN
jgi:hypothetical protein